MASIYKRVHPKTAAVSYQVQIRRTGYPTISKNFATEKEAKNWAIMTEAGMLSNSVKNPREKTRWTIPEVIEWYIKNPSEERKFETKKHLNRVNFLAEEFKDFTVETLSSKILLKWISARKKINQPSTVYHYYVALKNVLMHHANQHGYSQNLFEMAKCKTGSNQRERRFSAQETAILFSTANQRCRVKKREFKAAVLFALETGMRIGEMLKLEWKEVNLEKQTVDLLAKNTKTKKFRQVPITSVAKKILLWIKKHHNPENNKNKRVFDFYNVSEHHLSRQFSILCKKAGLTDVRWHDLRHEAASRFFEKAPHLTDMEIADILGHKSLNMLKRYVHLRPSRTVAKLW